MNHDLRKLKEIYRDKKLIPFLGAGLSTPYNLPNWKSLIKLLNNELVDDDKIKNIINEDIEHENYWESIDMIKSISYKNEFYIQNMTKDIMLKSKLKKVTDDNFKDISNLEVPFILTTNYDNEISNYIKSDYPPLILSDAGVSTQSWARSENMKQIVHLHGTFSNVKSIVLTKQKYEEVYSQQNYISLFNYFRSGYSFFFIGFSYSDIYIKFLMEKFKDNFNDFHYILMANPEKSLIQDLAEQNIIVIPYRVEDINNSEEHINEIRKVLNFFQEKEENSENF